MIPHYSRLRLDWLLAEAGWRGQIDYVLQYVIVQFSLWFQLTIYAELGAEVVRGICKILRTFRLFALVFFGHMDLLWTMNNNIFSFQLWVISFHGDWKDVDEVVFVESINNDGVWVRHHPNVITNELELLTSNWEINCNLSLKSIPTGEHYYAVKPLSGLSRNVDCIYGLTWYQQ